MYIRVRLSLTGTGCLAVKISPLTAPEITDAGGKAFGFPTRLQRMVVIHKAMMCRRCFTWNETFTRLNLSVKYRLKARALQSLAKRSLPKAFSLTLQLHLNDRTSLSPSKHSGNSLLPRLSMRNFTTARDHVIAFLESFLVTVLRSR